MSCDTMGRIKGYVKHEDIFDFIKQKWDSMATDSVKKDIPIPLSRCDWKYKFNEHSEDDKIGTQSLDSFILNTMAKTECYSTTTAILTLSRIRNIMQNAVCLKW